MLARRGTVALVAGSLAVAIASFFSWLLLAIGAWAAILVLVRNGRRRASASAIALAVTRPRRLRPLLAAQALLFEVLFCTIW